MKRRGVAGLGLGWAELGYRETQGDKMLYWALRVMVEESCHGFDGLPKFEASGDSRCLNCG